MGGRSGERGSEDGDSLGGRAGLPPGLVVQFRPCSIVGGPQAVHEFGDSGGSVWASAWLLGQQEYPPQPQLQQGGEGDQNMLPQNRPLWRKDYFELNETETQQMQEEFSALLISA